MGWGGCTHAAGAGNVCVTKAYRWLAELPRFSVVMMPASLVFHEPRLALAQGLE